MKLINQIAKETGLPVHTIRYYERLGLYRGKRKSAVNTNSYKYYDEEIVEKLQLINDAKELGFTLTEIKTLLDAWYQKQLSVEKKREILQTKQKEIDLKIRQLKRMRKQISLYLASDDLDEC